MASQNRATALAKNTLILTIGKISTQAISFFLLPLYTAYLTKQDYGVVDLVSTIVTLLIPILNLQIEQGIFRFMVTNRDDKPQLSNIVSTSFTFLFAQVLLVTAIFIVANFFVSNEYRWFLYANLVINMILFSLMQTMRGVGDNVGYAVAAVISSVCNIGVNLLLILAFGLGAKAMLTATIVGGIVASLFAIIRVKFWHYFNIARFNKQTLKELLLYSAPLVPNELSWWAIRASDRFVITAFLGYAANGIVAVANKIPSVFVMFYNIFGIAWTESVVLHLKEPDGEIYFSNMTNRMLRLFSCAGLGIIAVVPFIFGWLINESFAQSYYLIPLYIIGCVFNVVIGLISTVYIVHKQTKVIAKTSLVAAILCVVSALVLVNYIGIYASPVSNILGFGVMMIYRCVDLRKYVQIKWDVAYITSAILFAALVIASYYLQNQIVSGVMLLMTAVYAIFVNRSDLRELVTYCRAKLQCKSC